MKKIFLIFALMTINIYPVITDDYSLLLIGLDKQNEYHMIKFCLSQMNKSKDKVINEQKENFSKITKNFFKNIMNFSIYSAFGNPIQTTCGSAYNFKIDPKNSKQITTQAEGDFNYPKSVYFSKITKFMQKIYIKLIVLFIKYCSFDLKDDKCFKAGIKAQENALGNDSYEILIKLNEVFETVTIIIIKNKTLDYCNEREIYDWEIDT